MRVQAVTICLLLSFMNAFAQTQNVTTAKQEEVKATSLAADITYVSNLKKDSDAEKDRSTSIGITISRKLNTKLTARVIGGVDQSLVADTKTSVVNTQVSLSYTAIPLNETLELKPSIFGLLPTNEDDRKEATLQGGTGVAISLGQKTAFFGKSTNVNYGLSALKNYHEYTRTSTLGANISHRARYIISTSTQITPKITLVLSSYYQTGWTYDNVLRTNFYVKEGLGYAIGKNAELSVSHVNASNALRPNGVDSNVSVYDKNTSAIEVGISATY